MDANINVGLGTGSRERDLKALQFVAAQQDMVVKKKWVRNLSSRLINGSRRARRWLRPLA